MEGNPVPVVGEPLRAGSFRFRATSYEAAATDPAITDKVIPLAALLHEVALIAGSKTGSGFTVKVIVIKSP